MRVWLDNSVLAVDCQPEVSAILALGYMGRHRVLPVDESAYSDWLQKFDETHQEMYRFIRDDSTAREAAGGAAYEILVTRNPLAAGSGISKRLSPPKSIELLLHPFRLVLENTWSDWQFLLRMATSEERMRLEELFDKGWLVTSGGGQGELTKEVRRLCSGFEGAMRTAAFFDSDMGDSGEISKNTELAQAACAGILFYSLARRAIENYIPLQSLGRWANQGPKQQQAERRSLVVALASLRKFDSCRRDHFPMKTGYGKSLPSDLDGQQWLPLRSGFGKDIAGLFENADIMTEQDLRDDGGFAEVNPFVRRLLSAAR
jgi:hypothetical protein